MGDQSLTTTPNVSEIIEADTAVTTPPAPTDKPKVTTLIATGAKSDVERARQLFEKMTPWRSTSASSPADIDGVDVAAVQ